MNRLSVRHGVPDDIPQVHALIKELALYEKAPQEVHTTPAQMEEDFLHHQLFDFSVAEDLGTQKIVGMVLYYFGYSTWKGKMLYIDDIVVTESYRQQGVGRKLFEYIILLAKAEEVQQIRWHVLDWNEPAIRFYQKFQASLDPEWITGKLSKSQIYAFTNL